MKWLSIFIFFCTKVSFSVAVDLSLPTGDSSAEIGGWLRGYQPAEASENIEENNRNGHGTHTLSHFRPLSSRVRTTPNEENTLYGVEAQAQGLDELLENTDSNPLLRTPQNEEEARAYIDMARGHLDMVRNYQPSSLSDSDERRVREIWRQNGLFGLSKKVVPIGERRYDEVPEKERDAKECRICLEKFELDSKVPKALKCQHGAHFHSSCLKAWLEKSNSCPICRTVIGEDSNEVEPQPPNEEPATQQQLEHEQEQIEHRRYAEESATRASSSGRRAWIHMSPIEREEYYEYFDRLNADDLQGLISRDANQGFR